MDMLRIEDLSLSYGDKPVVQNLSLRVKKGQVVSIIGPNASGKSTILKSIAGIIKPVSGKIFIDNRRSYEAYKYICFEGQNLGNPVRRRKTKSLDRYGSCPRAGYPFV